MNKLKVAVGMSGGVDSGVSAKMLVDAGYEVAGVHLHFWAEEAQGHTRENKCCSTESLMAARRTCDMLGIPFYTYNFEEVFKTTVVEYFLQEYRQNRTPNPCVVCNRKVKTGRLVKYVQGLGFDLLATGHYIKIVQRVNDPLFEDRQLANAFVEVKYDDLELRSRLLEGRGQPIFLQRGEDRAKDQSYFLYTMQQEDLRHLVFPLANLTKDKTRALAKEWQLPVATSKESFEICFIPTDDHTEFLSRHLDANLMLPGEVVTTEGEVIGEHRGLPFYSIGQRRGFTSRKPIPFYVVGKDLSCNRLIVSDIMHSTRSRFEVVNVSWADENVELPIRCGVRLRNMGSIDNCLIEEKGENRLIVTLDVGQRGISPGQSAVFYSTDVVLGGGVIEEIIL